jgi:hypothetical protein
MSSIRAPAAQRRAASARLVSVDQRPGEEDHRLGGDSPFREKTILAGAEVITAG